MEPPPSGKHVVHTLFGAAHKDLPPCPSGDKCTYSHAPLPDTVTQALLMKVFTAKVGLKA